MTTVTLLRSLTLHYRSTKSTLLSNRTPYPFLMDGMISLACFISYTASSAILRAISSHLKCLASRLSCSGLGYVCKIPAYGRIRCLAKEFGADSKAELGAVETSQEKHQRKGVPQILFLLQPRYLFYGLQGSVYVR